MGSFEEGRAMGKRKLNDFDLQRAAFFSELDVLRGVVRKGGPSEFASAETLEALDKVGLRLERMRELSWPACLPSGAGNCY
jgi:hypothetical protein